MILLEGVTKTFKRTTVLDELSLEIDTGDRIALIGANGAGKTTLIRCLLGEYQFEGNITLNGANPRSERKQVLSQIGFVPQLPPPLKMPVEQLLSFSAGVCGCSSHEMEAVAAQLGLELAPLAKRPFEKLSGGQKQKLLIAIALGRPTHLLIMDEPAANLDPEARHTLFSILEQRQDETAMIISSHRLDEVAALVNRVIELDRGQVVLDDRVDDSVALSSLLTCTLTTSRIEPAFSTTIRSWGFHTEEDEQQWSGTIPGPDRLRFLGMLSRYAALLCKVTIEETR
ncbi:MAG: ABC transporter ATP-binding protein [Gammaproteobacteria bacterium]|jgi:ABC-2 type transport system ATP-binding protein|nr:ABC transporter ATP-binding protein [Gammaproteobacteria bacterium]